MVLFLAILVLVLGTIGFRRIPGENYSVVDSFYYALQLFGFGGPVPPGRPVELEIARLLGPLLVGYAALRGIFALSREQLQLVTFRLLLRNHVIVAGLGPIGFRLAICVQ